MKTQKIDNLLSEQIKRYKARLEGITIQGQIEKDSENKVVRILFEVPMGFPPMYAEIKEADVILITLEEANNVGIIQVRRGADYVLSILPSAGLEEDLPLSIRDIIQGTSSDIGLGGTQ